MIEEYIEERLKLLGIKKADLEENIEELDSKAVKFFVNICEARIDEVEKIHKLIK